MPQIAQELRGAIGQADLYDGREAVTSVGMEGTAAVLAQLDEIARRAGGSLLASVAARDRGTPGATAGVAPMNVTVNNRYLKPETASESLSFDAQGAVLRRPEGMTAVSRLGRPSNLSRYDCDT